jgi:hypothetical protein
VHVERSSRDRGGPLWELSVNTADEAGTAISYLERAPRRRSRRARALAAALEEGARRPAAGVVAEQLDRSARPVAAWRASLADHGDAYRACSRWTISPRFSSTRRLRPIAAAPPPCYSPAPARARGSAPSPGAEPRRACASPWRRPPTARSTTRPWRLPRPAPRVRRTRAGVDRGEWEISGPWPGYRGGECSPRARLAQQLAGELEGQLAQAGRAPVRPVARPPR